MMIFQLYVVGLIAVILKQRIYHTHKPQGVKSTWLNLEKHCSVCGLNPRLDLNKQRLLTVGPKGPPGPAQLVRSEVQG